jgi:hypothetical protein
MRAIEVSLHMTLRTEALIFIVQIHCCIANHHTDVTLQSNYLPYI